MTVRSRSDDATAGRSNDPRVLLLTSLAAGEKHGYALQQGSARLARRPAAAISSSGSAA